MSNCNRCGAPIVWGTTEASGAKMPLDPEPGPLGNVILVSREAGDHRMIVRVLKKDETPTVEGLRYVPHFATCPGRKQ